MNPWLEIILPVRNPGDKLLETAASLTAQTTRGFGVIVSDNHSTTGADLIARTSTELTNAGIPVRVVRPSFELGRVEHWNWAHAQGGAEWLKPLFVGDLLATEYVARLRARIEARPTARFVRCELEFRTSGEAPWITSAPFRAESLTPEEFLDFYPRLGNWIGGPANMAFARDTWRAVGGFAPQLPACADLRLAVMLALRHGLETLHEPLAVFQLHDQRFSKGIARRRVNGCLELWLILREARNYCQTVGLPWRTNALASAFLLQLRIDYFDPVKQRLKCYFGA